MLRPLPVFLVAGLLLATAPASAFGIGQVYDAGDDFPFDTVTDIAVGDGDNAGHPEVYTTAGSGVRQHRPQWSTISIDDGILYHALAVGDGDRDGANEVYAAATDGNIFRFHWTGSAWQQRHVGSLDFEQAPPQTLTIADLENDGLRELAVTDGDGTLYKVFFRNGAWTLQPIAQLDGVGITSWFGDGDRDGRAELYVGTVFGKLWQVERTPSGWGATVILDIGNHPITGVVVADADGNGKQEVFATGYDHRVHKLVRTSDVPSGWYDQVIAGFVGRPEDLTVGNVVGGPLPELYVPADNGHLGQVLWTGTGWAKRSVGQADDYLNTVAAGDGDADEEREVYVGSIDGDVYEYDP